MAFYDKFPYSNFHELNTDWIIQKIKHIDDSEAHTGELAEQAAASAQASAASAGASDQSARASAASAEASAGSAEDAAESAAGIEAAREQIYINTARLDNLIVDGTPTEGNTELLDIRVGGNGVTYSTAGDAVRGQYDELNQAFNKSEYQTAKQVNYNVNIFDGGLNHREINATTGEEGGIYQNRATSVTFIPCEGKNEVVVEGFSEVSVNANVFIYFYKADYSYISYSNTHGTGKADVVNDAAFFKFSITSPNNIDLNAIKESIFAFADYEKTSRECINELNQLIEILDAEKADFPIKVVETSFTPTRGIIKTDLTVYDSGETYTGQYTSISVNPGEVYYISGRSANSSYPCAFVTLADGSVQTLLGGDLVAYSDELITIPINSVTLYINGNTTYQSINIKKTEPISQQEFERMISPLKVLYQSGILYIKWKYDATHDFCITFGNVGNNNLFNFREAYYVENTDPAPSNNFAHAAGDPSWNMRGSDWIGPYMVNATNYPDAEAHWTGGNHLTDDTTGGITASQTSLSIKIDGLTTPDDGTIYSCDHVTVEWTNAVQAYNTMESDGTGLAVLNETWSLFIDRNAIKCMNRIHPTTDIVIERYYGLQATCDGKKYRYIGGAAERRAEYTFGTDANDCENNTCRTAKIYDTNFNMEMSIDPVDLGLFANNEGYSFFTSNLSKIYIAAVRGENNSISLSAGDECYISGAYVFK